MHVCVHESSLQWVCGHVNACVHVRSICVSGVNVCVHSANLCVGHASACMCTCGARRLCGCAHVYVHSWGVHGHICAHVECVGRCGLARSAQGPLPAFEGESDSRLLAGLPCGIYFCPSAHWRPE